MACCFSQECVKIYKGRVSQSRTSIRPGDGWQFKGLFSPEFSNTSVDFVLLADGSCPSQELLTKHWAVCTKHDWQFVTWRDKYCPLLKRIQLTCKEWVECLNLLKPTGYVMHQQFNIQQLYVLPTLYLCVLYLYENKQRLVPLTA